MSSRQRIENLERRVVGDNSEGREFLIKYRDGAETHLYNGIGPPWKTDVIEVNFRCEGEERQEFEKNMQAILNGEGTAIEEGNNDTRT